MNQKLPLWLLFFVELALLVACVWVGTHAETWEIPKQDCNFWQALVGIFGVALAVALLITAVEATNA